RRRHSDPDADRPGPGFRPGRRAGRRCRRLPGQAIRARGAAGPAAGAAAAQRRRHRHAPVRRYRARSRRLPGPSPRRTAATDQDRVRAARIVSPPPRPGAVPDPDIRICVGVRLRPGIEWAVGLHQLSAAEDGRATADPNRPRAWLRAAGRGMSLRTRVAIAVGVVVLCALAIVAAVVYPAVGTNLRAKYDQSLIQVAQNAPAVAAKLKHSGTAFGLLVPFGSTQLQILPDATAGPTRGFVAVTNHDVQVADGNDPPYFRDEVYKAVDYRIYTKQLPGNPGMLVRAGLPVSDATSTQAALGWLLAALIPAGAIGAAVVARLAAGRVLRPVGRLTEAVERIRATGDLSAPIETPGHDEISRLGQAFVAMTAALDESMRAQRRLVGDASHELRTPLTSLITNLE